MVVQRGVNFSFEINLGERRIRHSPTRKLNDVIFNQFSVDLYMYHSEISIKSHRIDFRKSGSELPSGLSLTRKVVYIYAQFQRYTIIFMILIKNSGILKIFLIHIQCVNLWRTTVCPNLLANAWIRYCISNTLNDCFVHAS